MLQYAILTAAALFMLSMNAMFSRLWVNTRYLFCKEMLPPGTEFAVLDLMDDLEAGVRAARDKDKAKAQKGLDDVSKAPQTRIYAHEHFIAATNNVISHCDETFFL